MLVEESTYVDLDFQLSYIVLHWIKVSLVQKVLMLMCGSLST